MNKKLNNYYIEEYLTEYARILLNKLYNLKLIHRKTKHNIDRPDLISEDESWGVEVTQSIHELEAKQNKIFQYEYYNDRNYKIVNQSDYLRIGESLHFIDNIAYFVNSHDKETVVNEILNTIKTKIIKLNNHGFNIYNYNSLFIYKDCISDYIEESIPLLQSVFINNTPHILFDNIYIFTNDFLFNLYKDTYIKTKLSNDLLKNTKVAALKYSKSFKV